MERISSVLLASGNAGRRLIFDNQQTICRCGIVAASWS